jgi:hypothetical protein
MNLLLKQTLILFTSLLISTLSYSQIDQNTSFDFQNIPMFESQDTIIIQDSTVTDSNGTRKTTYKIVLGSTKEDRDSNAFILTDWFQFDFGLTNFENGNGLGFTNQYRDLDLHNGKTFHINLAIVQQGVRLFTPKLRFVYGLGYEWNNYRFNDNAVRLEQGADNFTHFHDSSATGHKKSKLVAQYINVPLMLRYKPKLTGKFRSFKITAGVEVAYLVKSYTKTRLDGKRDKEVGDYNIEPLKLSGVVRIGTDDLQIFGKYGTEFFKSGEGPVMNPVSMGLTLFPF